LCAKSILVTVSVIILTPWIAINLCGLLIVPVGFTFCSDKSCGDWFCHRSLG
jgi:hypothetical protein